MVDRLGLAVRGGCASPMTGQAGERVELGPPNRHSGWRHGRLAARGAQTPPIFIGPISAVLQRHQGCPGMGRTEQKDDHEE
jgi:hypothetical protein